MDQLNHTFRTLSSPGESLHKVKSSKHFGFAYTVNSEPEITEILAQLRHAHPQANHVCYAWVLGLDRSRQRANDDGEPSNSAGKPILGQIEKLDLTNVLVAVVRYFGGTKLGVGGLIDAYRTAAEIALANAEIKEIQQQAHFQIDFNYSEMSALMLAIRSRHWHSYDQIFETACQIKISVLPGREQEVQDVLAAFPDIRLLNLGIY